MPEPMFAEVATARRIEEAECTLVVEIAEASRGRPGFQDTLVIKIAGGAAVFSFPGSPLNKLVGLGFAGPLEEAALAAVEGEFKRLGAPLQAELSTLADNSIAALLTRRGYILMGFENVLALSLDQATLSHLENRTLS